MQLLRDAERGAAPGRPSIFVGSSAQAGALLHASRGVANKQLQQLLPAGLGFHNAGLEGQDRTTVESLFLQGHLAVCTHPVSRNKITKFQAMNMQLAG